MSLCTNLCPEIATVKEQGSQENNDATPHMTGQRVESSRSRVRVESVD